MKKKVYISIIIHGFGACCNKNVYSNSDKGINYSSCAPQDSKMFKTTLFALLNKYDKNLNPKINKTLYFV